MTINDLTPEQLEKLEEYRGIIESTYIDKELNREATVEYIEFMYKLCKLEKPTVLIAHNPKEFKIMFELVEKDSSQIDKIFDLKKSDNPEATDREIDYEEYLRGFDITTNVDIEKAIEESKSRSHYVWLISSYAKGFLTYHHFANKVMGIKTEHEKELNHLYDLSIKADLGRCFFEEKYVICLKSPDRLYFNEDSQLHSVEQAAIQYNNQPGYYYINGINLKEEVFKGIRNKSFTTEEFFKIQNEEVKSACIAMMQELYGEEGVFNFFRSNLTEVDTYVDKKEEKYLEGTTRSMNVGVYTLFKGEINDEPVAYVRCYCPSTDRMFFLGVESTHTKADDAIASLLLIPNKLIGHVVDVARQGEVFSIVLSEKGNKIAKSLKEEDYNNRSCLSGREYFEKMTYEY